MNLDPVGERLARDWGFAPTEELPGGHCSRVYASNELVLKVPWRGEEATSGATLALQMSGNAGPVVHAHDPETGSLLMDRVRPGTNLLETADSEAMPVFLDLALGIRALSCDGLMRLEDCFPVENPFINHMISTSPPPVALHGDLHHENILLGDRWWAIDPKGLAGDPAYEAVAFLRNPLGAPDLAARLPHRLDVLAAGLGCDPQRIAGWALLDAWDSTAENPPGSPGHELRQSLELRIEKFGLPD